MKCSQNHYTGDCPHSDPTTKKVPEAILKCKLCGEKHTARFKDCAKRIEFQQIRESLRAKNQKGPTTSLFTGTARYNQQFPALHNSTPFTPIADSTPVYSSLLKKPSPSSMSEDLFTPQECFKIFEELYSSLLSCKSKAEQIFVISKITCKFLESTTQQNAKSTTTISHP